MSSIASYLDPANLSYLTIRVLYAFLAYLTYRVIHATILYPYFLSPLRALPGPPLGIPLIGVARAIITSTDPGVDPQRTWMKEYGPVSRSVSFFGMERLVFSEAGALERVLASGWVDFPRPAFMRHLLGLVAGYGLLTVTGDEHRQMRKAVNPAFSIANLMAQTHMYYDAIEGLVDILRAQIDEEAHPGGGKVIPVYEWVSKATLDIICSAAFGYHTDTLHDPANPLAVAYEALLSLQSGLNMSIMIILLSIPYIPSLLRTEWVYTHRRCFAYLPLLHPIGVLVQCMWEISVISREMLREKMREAAEDGDGADGKRDVMSLLVRARRADARRVIREKESTGNVLEVGGGGSDADASGSRPYMMSDDDMVEQVLTFLGAGHETTASTLTWTLWLLANDIPSQQRLRGEVTPVLDANSRPDYRTLKSMTWLDCVIMESMRVMPAVAETVRQAGTDRMVEGVFVPKGTFLFIEGLEGTPGGVRSASVIDGKRE